MTNIFDQKFKVFSFLLILSVQSFFISVAHSSDDTTIDCTEHRSQLNERVCEEKKLQHQRFVLIPYKPNYFLASWDRRLESDNPIFDNYETKFQLSFKVPINLQRDDTRWLWYFAYTQTSVWQMFNFSQSAPFRDTNFEPELILTQSINAKLPFLDWDLRLINYGLIDHQSNGKTPPNSRSWNRSYIDFIIEKDRNYVSLKTWYRWKEDQKFNPTDFKGDDNPDIEDFLGHGELKFFHAGEQSNYSITYRDSSKGGKQGTYQLDWSVPILEKRGLRFYIQYFNGFGETLIDYNVKRERLGLGLMLTDWL